MTFQVIFEHLSMVIVALLFALIAGVPLGVLSYFYPRAGKIILRVVDLIQTTPALALLGSPPSLWAWPSIPCSPSYATRCWASTRCPLL